jgi:hypothetical protein
VQNSVKYFTLWLKILKRLIVKASRSFASVQEISSCNLFTICYFTFTITAEVMADNALSNDSAVSVAQRRNQFSKHSTIPDLKPVMRDRFGDFYQGNSDVSNQPVKESSLNLELDENLPLTSDVTYSNQLSCTTDSTTNRSSSVVSSNSIQTSRLEECKFRLPWIVHSCLCIRK